MRRREKPESCYCCSAISGVLGSLLLLLLLFPVEPKNIRSVMPEEEISVFSASREEFFLGFWLDFWWDSVLIYANEFLSLVAAASDLNNKFQCTHQPTHKHTHTRCAKTSFVGFFSVVFFSFWGSVIRNSRALNTGVTTTTTIITIAAAFSN